MTKNKYGFPKANLQNSFGTWQSFHWPKKKDNFMKISRDFPKLKFIQLSLLYFFQMFFHENIMIVLLLFMFGFNALTRQNKVLVTIVFHNFWKFLLLFKPIYMKFFWQISLPVCIHSGLPTRAKVCKCTCLMCSAGKTTRNLNEMWGHVTQPQ